MNKLVLAFAAVVFSLSLNAQKISGSATYKTASKMDIKLPDDIPPERKKAIEARMAKAMQKEFSLEFNRNESLYKEVVELDKESGNARGMRMMTMFTGGTNGTFYKNNQEQRYTDATEFFGKKFLVKDSLEQFDWKLGSETKTIGNYICNKATAMQVRKTMTIKTKDGGGMEDSAGVDTSYITAWYTMQVPINHGPGKYQGLPGLILEVNDDGTTILCTKVAINTKEEKEIEEPSEGDEMTRAEFEEMAEKKMQEMQRMMKGRNNGHGRGGFEITIKR